MELLAAATVFHPALKDCDAMSEECKEFAIASAKKLIPSPRRVANTKPTTGLNTTKSNTTTILSGLTNKSSVTTNKGRDNEINQYLFEKISGDVEFSSWWERNEHRYPTLAKVVKKLFALNCTSASSERCFSKTGNVVTKKRNRLLPGKVAGLVQIGPNEKAFVRVYGDRYAKLVEEERCKFKGKERQLGEEMEEGDDREEEEEREEDVIKDTNKV